MIDTPNDPDNVLYEVTNEVGNNGWARFSSKRCSTTRSPSPGGTRADLEVDLPAGDYTAEWIDAETGAKAKAEDVAGGSVRTLRSPDYAEGIALRIARQREARRCRESSTGVLRRAAARPSPGVARAITDVITST